MFGASYVTYETISDTAMAAFILGQVDPGATPEGNMLATSRVIGPDDHLAALVFVCLSATRHRPVYLIVHVCWPALTGQMLISDGRDLVTLPVRSDGYEFVKRYLVQEGYL